ncbi:MAG: pirin family protein [Flavobacteriales bacterium]|nr:pirin family protein [Flavobacteriales bacterium]
MSDKIERRSFINRMTLGLSAVFAAPVILFGNKIKNQFSKDQKLKSESMNPVLNNKPMGFQWETSDPFLFCVHHEDKFPKGNEICGPDVSLSGRHLGDDFIIKDGFRMYHGKKVPGFPGHPHRGFETITIVREGIVDHADSLGAAGRYGNGDVQWMTAGGGVQHSEMFPLLNKDKENPMELFQIWLNLPARNKMVPPHFKMLWSDSIPVHHSKDANGLKAEVEVIAGKFGEHIAPEPPPDSWASDPQNEVAVWNIKLEPGAKLTLPKAGSGINRTLYFYTGKSLKISGQTIGSYTSSNLQANIEVELENGPDEGRVLILQGKPIGEQVIQYGPFVMNTKEEIQKAFEDYHATQFGGWPWPKTDQVHDRNLGRFALHADGRREVKS